jgi:DNA sulfur modification protein DndD
MFSSPRQAVGYSTKFFIKLDEVQNELNTVEEDLSELDRAPDSSDDDESRCIKHIEISLRDAEVKYAEITQTIDIKGKYTIVNSIIDKAYDISIKAIKELIVNETNTKMESLLPLELVKLSSIGDSLKLMGKGGASAGQTLALAYGFLSTLFSRGNHQLPFIVDSPSGPLDLTVRRQVAKLIPKLCNQFVAFTISSERENFTEPLEEEIGDVQYITLFRKSTSTNHLLSRLPTSGVVEQRNSILVADKTFFYNFDLEEEVL